MDLSDEESWKRTVLALLTMSVAIFVIQRIYFMFLNPIFEFCVFHMTTMVSIIIYAYISRKKKAVEVTD